MNEIDKFRHPIKNARGLGSAKDGVHHFLVQRVTAVALLFLCVHVVYLLFTLMGSDYQAARATVAHPFNAILLIAFLVAMFWHGQLGMQVVIEDYVHRPLLAFTAQLIVKFVCGLAALASILAVIRIALGA